MVSLKLKGRKMFHHKLVHAFIPHPHNGYRPHAFRHKWLSLYSLGIIISHFAFGIAFYTGPVTVGEAAMSKNVIDLTNQARNERGISVLTENDLLTKAAYAK